MSRAKNLEQHVAALYENPEPKATEWIDWLYDNHVVPVADYASKLALRFNANKELSRVAALLHDIADIKLSRDIKAHAEESLKIARKLMVEHEYNDNEIKLVVDDAIRYHSCHNGYSPKTIEGRVLATADSQAHLLTGFYPYALWAFGKNGESHEAVKDWALAKLERDYNSKLQFEEVRNELKQDYENLKIFFSR